jgi:hypothetical protein
MQLPRITIRQCMILVGGVAVLLAGIRALDFWGGLPSRNRALTAGEKACRPIIDALTKYHSAHGRYPDALEDLVTSRLIDRVPDTPEIGRSKRWGITYEASLPNDVYQLSFSYEVAEGILPACVRLSYMSDEARWEGRKYPGSFWSKTCERAARRYRERRDAATLRAFIETVTTEPDFNYFYASRVKEWLGEGEERAIPHDLSEKSRKGYCYGSEDGSARICFTYRSHILPMGGDERKDFPIVDTLYEIETVDGIEKWRVLLKSP